MCEVFGYEVTRLERIRIMNVSLKGLALGDWRDLTPQEVETILALTERSSADAEATGQRGGQKPARGKPTGGKRGIAKGRGKSGAPHRRDTAKSKAGGKATPGGKAADPKAKAAAKKAAGTKTSSKPAGKAASKGGGPAHKSGRRLAKPAKSGKGRRPKPGR